MQSRLATNSTTNEVAPKDIILVEPSPRGRDRGVVVVVKVQYGFIQRLGSARRQGSDLRTFSTPRTCWQLVANCALPVGDRVDFDFNLDVVDGMHRLSAVRIMPVVAVVEPER